VADGLAGIADAAYQMVANAVAAAQAASHGGGGGGGGGSHAPRPSVPGPPPKPTSANQRSAASDLSGVNERLERLTQVTASLAAEFGRELNGVASSGYRRSRRRTVTV
jgi:hypothetical protein